jgi:hypothetical protein
MKPMMFVAGFVMTGALLAQDGRNEDKRVPRGIAVREVAAPLTWVGPAIIEDNGEFLRISPGDDFRTTVVEIALHPTEVGAVEPFTVVGWLSMSYALPEQAWRVVMTEGGEGDEFVYTIAHADTGTIDGEIRHLETVERIFEFMDSEDADDGVDGGIASTTPLSFKDCPPNKRCCISANRTCMAACDSVSTASCKCTTATNGNGTVETCECKCTINAY